MDVIVPDKNQLDIIVVSKPASRLLQFVNKVFNIEDAGTYSEEQYIDYLAYSQRSTFLSLSLQMFRIYFFICGVTVAVFSIYLVDPTLPVSEQSNLFLLCIAGYGFAAHTALQIYAALFPELRLSWFQTLWLSLPFSIICTVVLRLLSSMIGFPLPFSNLIPILPCFPTLVFPVYHVSRNRLRNVEHFTRRFRSFGLIVVLTMSYIIIYPLLTVLLKSIKSDILKSLVSLSFPLLKFLVRFILFQLTNDTNLSFGNIKTDLAPTICVFTIEFFNCFYLSVMIHEGISLFVVLPLIAIDVIANIHYVRALLSLGQDMSKTMGKGRQARLIALHVSEFVVLTEFVECLVPVFYGSITGGLYNGPNRKYFKQFHGMTDSMLRRLYISYASLFLFEFLFLVLRIVFIYYRLELNLIKQLDFRLYKSWYLIAVLISWCTLIIFSMKLEHFGFDFTFQFTWLNGKR